MKGSASSTRHLIESVSFKGQIVVCTCGVTTTLEGWPEHRGELGRNVRRGKKPFIAVEMGNSERWR